MARLIYGAAVAQFLVISLLAAPLVGQNPIGPSGFRLGVATEYVVAKGFLSDELKNGVGVRLHTDFRLSSVWTFRLSFKAGRYTGRLGWEHHSIPDTGVPVADPDTPPNIRFSAYSVMLGPRVHKGIMNDRLGVIAGVDVGVSQFGEMAEVSDGYLAGVVLGGEARLFQHVWLTVETAADIAWVSYSSEIASYGDGQLFSFRLGCAVPF